MMRNWLKVGAVIVAVTVTVACGKSEEEKKTEQAAADLQKAAEALGRAGAAQGISAAAKALEGVAAGLGGGDGKTVDPVSFESLQSALPSMSGWEMEKPKGERMTSPFPFSQTETSYKKGDSDIHVKVVDTGFAQLLIAPWSVMLASGFNHESSDGYEKATTVGSNPAFETWKKESKRGDLNILVGKRFMVSIEGTALADTKVLQDFAAKMDLDKLAAAK